MRVFLLDKSYSGEKLYTLRKREVQYLSKVLRLDSGAVFTVKDTRDNYYKATLLEGGMLAIEECENPDETMMDSLSSYSGPFAPIDVYVSILKGKKNEGVVRALTEIGVRKITFVDSQNVQEHDFSSHQRERLETIMKEAVQQSGGSLPSLSGPLSFDEAVRGAEGIKAILHQGIREKSTTLHGLFEKSEINFVSSVFIGPEGGFSDEECLLAENNGVTPVLLSTNILRAETAAVYTAAALQAILHEKNHNSFH